jgi:hypothetical protein
VPITTGDLLADPPEPPDPPDPEPPPLELLLELPQAASRIAVIAAAANPRVLRLDLIIWTFSSPALLRRRADSELGADVL